MKKHDDFEIWLHENDELVKIHGANIISREPLRSWPLSVVERVAFNDGASRIYKAFRNLPVETEFYRAVQSRHIPKVFYNYSDGDNHWLLFENVDGRHPVNLNRNEMLNLGCQVRQIIDEFSSAEKLYRYDLSAKGYGSFVSATIELLTKLRKEEKFNTVDEKVISRIEKALSHTEVKRTVHGKCVMLHGDLKCDNIIIRPDGSLVIIDWQNILFGPEDIDAYTLMATQNIDPVPVVGIGSEILRLALLIKWFADCADRWLPYWASGYERMIADIEKQIQAIVGNSGL